MRDPQFFLKKYAPVTTNIAFLDRPLAQIDRVVFGRSDESARKWNEPAVQHHFVPGALDQKLESLLPLVAGYENKRLLSATRSRWTAYFINGYPFGDVHTEPSWLAEHEHARSLSVILVEDVPRSIPGSVQFVWRDATGAEPAHRIIEAHKESRWEFRAYGEPLPFEELERYQAKKIRDRLTIDMVERYCRHLGIELFDPDFYFGDAYIIEEELAPTSKLYPSYPNRP